MRPFSSSHFVLASLALLASVGSALPLPLAAQGSGGAAKPAAARAQASSGESTRWRRIEVRRLVTPTVSVRFSGSFATLRIVGWAHDSVVITGTVPADARFETGWAGSATERVAGMKGFLEPADQKGVTLPAGEIEMRVPERARVWSKAGSASIEVSGVRGGLDLAIVGGSIRVAGAPSELRVDAMDGAIEIVGTPQWLRAKSASGDILVRGGSEDAAISTVSGALRVGEGRYERLRLESVAGAVTFAGELARGAALDIDSHGGDVELLVSRKQGADYELSSIAGRVENRWGTPAPVMGREGRGMSLAFSAGGGGARVTVRSFKGTIRLGEAGKGRGGD